MYLPMGDRDPDITSTPITTSSTTTIPKVESPRLTVTSLDKSSGGGGGGEGGGSSRSLPDMFPVVALGGTFDHLHAGHKILLSMAAWITEEKIIVGVTGEAYLSSPFLF